jgi:hypothetical protein
MSSKGILISLMRDLGSIGRQILDSSGPRCHYGQKGITNNAVGTSVTVATDTTLKTNSDYVQVTGIFDASPSGLSNGIIHNTNTLKVTRAGTYELKAWSSLVSSTSNINVSFRFAVNGVIAMNRRHWARLGTSSDRVGFAAHGYIPLNVNDEVSVWIAADKTASITIEDGVFSLKEILAS